MRHIAGLFTLMLPILLALIPLTVLAQKTGKQQISIERLDDRLAVWVGEGNEKDLFTEYRFAGYRKPILYPVFASGDVAITRHYPMEEGHVGEASDHPHHKSIWFAHGDVNGIDFWSEKADIRHRSIEEIDGNRIVVTNDWVDGQEVVCQDRTTIRFLADADWRLIDYSVTILASQGDIVFGDTKEGTFAVRTHPALRLVDIKKQPAGTAVNSEGVEGDAIWGKHAKWVHYRGDINDQTYSVTIMDHPDNLRHPTTWHAREYGLIAANPFGLSYFQDAEKGAGNHELHKGESLTFHYAVMIGRRDFTVQQINDRFNEFAK